MLHPRLNDTAKGFCAIELDVESDTVIAERGKPKKGERRYYFSRADGEAAYFQKAIRQHWNS